MPDSKQDDKAKQEDPNKKQDFLEDFNQLNKNPPSVKDGPMPKPGTDKDADNKKG